MALPRQFVTGILIFCIFIVGGMFLITNFGLQNTKTGEFNSTFNKVTAITEKTDAIRDSITKAETDFGAFGVLNSLINSAWIGLGILFDTVDLTGTIFTDSANFFGLPSGVFAIVGLLTAVCVVFISFAIWSAIFQRDL